MRVPGALGRVAIGFGLAVSAGAARHLARAASSDVHIGNGRLVPKLSPKSDSHFFGHDYPHDFKPTSPLEKDFDHPYPVVQESDIYDKDFVKDENSDNGEWHDQMEYDRLRTRMEKLNADERRIRRKKEEAGEALEAERANQKQFEEEERKAEEALRKNESEAQAEVDKAKAAKDGFKPAHLNKTEDGGNGTVDEVGVANASKRVEKELDDIEECKKKLAKAQAQLKKLHEEVKQVESKDKRAQDMKESTSKEEAALRQKEIEARAELREAEARHNAALKAFQAENEELHDMEARLAKTEERLLTLRRGVDQDGGVYRSQSGAGRPAACGTAALTALALLVMRCATL